MAPDRILTDDHEDGGFLSRVIPKRLVPLIRYMSTPPDVRYVFGPTTEPPDEKINQQLRDLAFSETEIEGIKLQCRNFCQLGFPYDPVAVGRMIKGTNQSRFSLEEFSAAAAKMFDMEPEEGEANDQAKDEASHESRVPSDGDQPKSGTRKSADGAGEANR